MERLKSSREQLRTQHSYLVSLEKDFNIHMKKSRDRDGYLGPDQFLVPRSTADGDKNKACQEYQNFIRGTLTKWVGGLSDQ